MKTIVSVCSARPNFVKVAAVHHALAAHPDQFTHVIVHTGQHYDPLFSDVFFEQLRIPTPAFNLGIHGGTREEMIAATKRGCEDVFPKIKPDVVLVYGDVNGAVGAAEAAKDLGIRLAHVEAGLRSFDLAMPEEHNRLEIDRLADLLLCSEESGVNHLTKEGVKGAIHLVGNTMIDTLIRMLPVIDAAPLPLNIAKPFAVATIHRPHNVDTKDALIAVTNFLWEVASVIPVILPAHHRMKNALQTFGIAMPAGIHVVDALGYVPFLRLMKDSAFILTDSGGIQEEATLIKKRCFTLRRTTERPSTVESGSNVLIDPDVAADRAKVLSFAKDPSTLDIKVPQFWDGQTGERIAEILAA